MEEFPLSLKYQDCVRAQYQLVMSLLKTRVLDLVIGFSMGGQCAYYWTLMHPEVVRDTVIICSSARTSRHNYQFLEGPKAALEFSADYNQSSRKTTSLKPTGGLRAFGKAYSAWLTSPQWFEDELYKTIGYGTLSEWDKVAAGTNYDDWDPDDLLAMIDQYFRWEASKKESLMIPQAKFKVIPSAWGHLSGLGYDKKDESYIDEAISKFLSGCTSGWKRNGQ
ncbi:hypothetical protein FSARC_12595 [Fusarium sarcochroum]|uniref:AB hydrolase-1 domain-containing protein n=1 Tax=Fusarium sarcochroum TaxID=1208366 RepID=A0A8H4T7A6_9HYPO|nr:hypothetical protein FSARC_12595 [Fusarium sarcochroum]